MSDWSPSLEVNEDIIRLEALGNALQAMAILADENQKELNFNEVEEIGKMVCEVAQEIMRKLEEGEYKKPKAA